MRGNGDESRLCASGTLGGGRKRISYMTFLRVFMVFEFLVVV